MCALRDCRVVHRFYGELHINIIIYEIIQIVSGLFDISLKGVRLNEGAISPQNVQILYIFTYSTHMSVPEQQ